MAEDPSTRRLDEARRAAQGAAGTARNEIAGLAARNVETGAELKAASGAAAALAQWLHGVFDKARTAPAASEKELTVAGAEIASLEKLRRAYARRQCRRYALGWLRFYRGRMLFWIVVLALGAVLVYVLGDLLLPDMFGSPEPTAPRPDEVSRS